MSIRSILPITAIMLILIVGCSTGGMSPLIPDTPAIPQQGADVHEQAARNPEQSVMGMRMPLGIFSCIAVPDAGLIEIEPLRMMDMHLNVLPMLEGGTQNLVTLASPPVFSNGGKQLDVVIRLKHPETNSIFAGFDVHGIFISEGTMSGWNDPDIVIAGAGETRLLNPDGYTRWWNPKEFTNPGIFGYSPGEMGSVIQASGAATLNGYKTFSTGFGADTDMEDLDPGLRGMFWTNELWTRHYTISLEGGLHFNYAVDASWAYPNVVPPTGPGHFPPNANMQEAYWINVEEPVNSLWWEDGVGHGGNVFYNITIHDWQGAEGIGDARIEIPSVGVNEELTNLVDEGADYKKFEYQVTLPELQSDDALEVLLSVDSLTGSYQPNATGVDKPLRAYELHSTQVASEEPPANLPPVCEMEATTPTDILVLQSVIFDASASYDPDGEIVQYQWDFDGDDVFGDSWDLGSIVNPTKVFDTYGAYDVRCRVEDDDGATSDSLPVTVNVTFEENHPPYAIAEAVTDTDIVSGMSVTFDASASYDIDGSIETYEWDFDGDGNYGDGYDSGTDTNPVKYYWSSGVYDVDLKVIDNEAAEDFLDEAITVTVGNAPPVAYAEFTTPAPYYIDEEYTVTASGSNDPDGTIEVYEWDIDYDGVTFTPTVFTEDVNVQWDTPGQYSIMLRVEDNDGAEDFLDEALEVNVYSFPEITDIKVTYEDPQKVTWTITGSGFSDITGDIITDLPTGYDETVVSWTNEEIVCKFTPYSMDVNATVYLSEGIESDEYLVREANGILVIYNTNSEISGQIKDYYISPVTGRGIPAEHVMGLDAPTAETISRDAYNLMKDDIEWWMSFNEAQYEVKYIVTCKGIPLRINKVSGSSYNDLDYACVDSELCLLFETYSLPGRTYNPYYKLSAPEVFHPWKFSYGGVTASYLTMRLSGYTLEEVTGMIDRCMNPYTGDDVYYILDDDPDIWYDRMPEANTLLQNDGLNVYFDNTDVFVLASTINDPLISDHVMGYTGHGVHHSNNPGKYYIINDLEFTYPNGAIFNSYESFNGTTFTWESHSGHGMVGDFIRMGGCGGIGHVFEPWSDAVGDERVLYRWYERGYTMAEAQYMGCRYLSWTEVVAGEPLCRIAVWDG